MTELSFYDAPFSGMETRIVGWVSEALELRHGAGGDPKGKLTPVDPTDGTPAITEALLRVRVRSDRVDELLSRVTLERGRAKRAKEGAQFAADTALMEATKHHADRRVEFSSGREREAEAKLDSLEQRRLAHQSDRLVGIANDAYEVISQVHWQLDGIRKDIRATLHALQFESSLER